MALMNYRPLSPRAAGFTLVEILVAIVVLSIGLLGIAKLSLGSVQSNGSAFMRSQATELVQQIVDDMHANQPEAVAGSYNIALGANPGAAPNCVTAVCTTTQIATFDLARWNNRLTTLLPGGQGAVAVAQVANPTTGRTESAATVIVQWNDSVAQMAFANGAAAPTQTMVITVETLL
jgi:type IV pilus assembly protein PilV